MSQHDPHEILRAKINGETSTLSWGDLALFFARGVVIKVDAQLDLIDVAAAFSEDNGSIVSQWMATGQVGKLDDQSAQDWAGRNPTLWAVVVAPWVLVQEGKSLPSH